MRIPGYTPGAETTPDAKDKLRRAVRARRVEIDEAHRARAAGKVAAGLPRHPLVERLPPGNALIPSRHRDELDTHPLAASLEAAGWRIHRPRAHEDPPRIDAVEWPTKRTLVRGYAGIPEPMASAPRADPRTLGLVVVPGIAFDPAGRRIGTGLGFFDRFLAPLLASASPPVVIGVGFDVQLVDAVPEEPHDIRVHGLQIEETSLVCRDARRAT